MNEPVRERVSPPADRELQNTFRRLDIKAQNPRRRRLGGSPTWPYSSESESSSGQSPGAPGSSGPSRHGTADPEADDWTKYAKALQGGGSSAQYACTWVETGDNIFDNACGYVSKKHLVKRHIESKHLQIKYGVLSSLSRTYADPCTGLLHVKSAEKVLRSEQTGPPT